MTLIGKPIDRYRITEQLGQGGMAVVYRATDTRLDREVAIKVIRTGEIPESQRERLLQRFEREAKAQARFNHANIVPVHDYGEFEGQPYLVMALLPGGTLRQHTGKPMPFSDAAALLAPVADALAYAHEQGVLHRDVKPSNIMLSARGVPLLSDFGIAKLLEAEEGFTLTGTGIGIGTPEYMAPEQWKGESGPQTDVYALGVVLYELVTGRRPYTATTPQGVGIKQATEPLPPPRQFAADLSDAAERVILKALALNPKERHASMAEFKAALTGMQTSQSLENPEATEPEMSSAGAPATEIELSHMGDDALTRDVRLATSPARVGHTPTTAPTELDNKPSPRRPPSTQSKRTPTRKPAAGISWWIWGTGGLAATLVLGLLTVVILAIAIIQNINQPPETTAGPTFSPPAPTAVPVAQPTNPVRQRNSAPFSDDFSDPTSGWDRQSDSNGKTDYSNGVYQIDIYTQSWLMWANPGRIFTDAIIELEATTVGLTPHTDEEDDNNFGIVCRHHDTNNFYALVISSDGYYGIRKRLQGESEMGFIGIDGMDRSDAINQGNATNHLRAECLGSTLRLIVNGTLLMEVTDTDIPNGDVGLMAGTFSSSRITILFDDFEVFSP